MGQKHKFSSSAGMPTSLYTMLYPRLNDELDFAVATAAAAAASTVTTTTTTTLSQ
jgi:hypothetical protein